MTVGELSTNEIHLSKRRKSGKPENPSQLPIQENSGASTASEQVYGDYIILEVMYTMVYSSLGGLIMEVGQ